VAGKVHCADRRDSVIRRKVSRFPVSRMNACRHWQRIGYTANSLEATPRRTQVTLGRFRARRLSRLRCLSLAGDRRWRAAGTSVGL